MKNNINSDQNEAYFFEKIASASQKKARICKIIHNYDPAHADNIISYMSRLGYFIAPASIGHHGNHIGGLAEHSLAVANLIRTGLRKQVKANNKIIRKHFGLNIRTAKYSDVYSQLKEAPADHTITDIIAIFHDFCKCLLYKNKDGEWVKRGYDDLMVSVGQILSQDEIKEMLDGRNRLEGLHGLLSLYLVKHIAMPLTPQMADAIRWHMGLYTQDNPNSSGSGLSIETLGWLEQSNPYLRQIIAADMYCSAFIL